MFSSWFDQHHQGYIVARIWQVQEYDDARKYLLYLVSTTS